MSERKLKAWEGAGLIDAATAARIRAWEAEHARPLGLWAVIGIAALCIGLGLISVVAANWDAIPGVVRLALHFALLLGTAALIFLRGSSMAERQPWLHEAALFILGMLGLTFMGHIGQVYQTSSPLWQPLLLWLVLFAPLLLGRGLSWLTAAMLMVTLVVTVWDYAIKAESAHSRLGDWPTMIRMATATALPVVTAGIVPWLRERGLRLDFWRRLVQLAMTYAVGGASLAVIVSAFDSWLEDSEAGLILGALTIYAAVALVTAGLIYRRSAGPSGKAQAAILTGGAAAILLAYFCSGSQFMAAAIFIVFWAGIAAASLHAGWRGTFQAAVGVIAFRLIVLSFELAADLLTSGAGLIFSGLLILGIAFGAVRVSKAFAPKKQADSGGEGPA